MLSTAPKDGQKSRHGSSRVRIVLEAAFDAAVVPQLIVYDPDALQSGCRRSAPADADSLEARAGGAEIFEASAAAVDRASETRTPQGVVAAVAETDVTPEKVRRRRRGRLRPIVLVLDAVSDPGNLGTILRSALAADVDEVLARSRLCRPTRA